MTPEEADGELRAGDVLIDRHVDWLNVYMIVNVAPSTERTQDGLRLWTVTWLNITVPGYPKRHDVAAMHFYDWSTPDTQRGSFAWRKCTLVRPR